jgi:hypothetical protein
MMDWKQKANDLLEEVSLCLTAKPKHDAINIQLEKDTVSRFAHHLSTQRGWGTDAELAEACQQLETRLVALKEKIIMEILTNVQ